MNQEEKEELKGYLKTLNAFEITSKKGIFFEKVLLKYLSIVFRKKDFVPFMIGSKQPFGLVIFEKKSLKIISDFSKKSYKESLYTNVINPIENWLESNGFNPIFIENDKKSEIKI